MRKRKGWADFVGLGVEIKFRDGDDNWPYFHVISFDGDYALLRGIDYPDGSGKHEGDCISAAWKEVKTIKAIEKQPEPNDAYFEAMGDAGDYSPKIRVDQVDHPPHYKLPGGEAIDITEHMNFCRGNAIKYIVRAGRKDPSKEVEDLRKAVWYLDREIKRLGGGK